jgi:hypothetical protein
LPILWQGTLKKMRVEATEPITYWLRDGYFDPAARSEELPLTDLVDGHIQIRFTGQITCVYCGRKTKKSFGQGFCYPCFQARAEADICMVKPELCHYFDEADPCRDENFAQSQCFQPHILYVALTSGLKVGITRRANIPSRWIDQGAVAAIPLAELPSRREVGLLENRLSQKPDIQDKTHWMRMLKEEAPQGDLTGKGAQVLGYLEEWEIKGILPAAQRVTYCFHYPVSTYPEKVRSFNLDKESQVGGQLNGIKGQYLIFEEGVINLRKFTGYAIEVSS